MEHHSQGGAAACLILACNSINGTWSHQKLRKEKDLVDSVQGSATV